MPKLAEELKMNRPFALREEEAVLSIVRTSDVLGTRFSNTLKSFDLTATQYNVLRILRGSPDGLPCGQISERLIAQDPDTTRLLDRMEARSWIRRHRSTSDRRVVLARITQGGLDLLDRAAPFVLGQLKDQFKGWKDQQIQTLIELLEKVRDTNTHTPKEMNPRFSAR